MSECPGVKNYKWRLKPVWHRMLYSCSLMATVGVKGLRAWWLHCMRDWITLLMLVVVLMWTGRRCVAWWWTQLTKSEETRLSAEVDFTNLQQRLVLAEREIVHLKEEVCGLCLLRVAGVCDQHLLILAVIEDWYHVSPALVLWLVTGAVINRVMSSCIVYLQTLFFGCFFQAKNCKNGHKTGVCEYTVQLLVAVLITVLTQLSLCSATELAIAFRSFSLEILWRLLQWCILCIFYILFILFFYIFCLFLYIFMIYFMLYMFFCPSRLNYFTLFYKIWKWWYFLYSIKSVEDLS